jgi:hypothetical protein
MENLRFEESFKEAFTGAEIAPSGAVWTNVELGLEKSSGGKLKGRILFFQLLAAASMVFAMGVGSVYFLNSQYDAVQPIAQKSINPGQDAKRQPVNDQPVSHDQANPSFGDNSKSKSNREATPIENERETESLVSASKDQSFGALSTSESTLISTRRALPKLVDVEKPRFKISKSEPDPGMLLLAKLRDEERKSQKEEPKLKEKLWASLGFGAGTYNPNSSVSNSNLYALSDGSSFSPQSTADPVSGASYSVGLSVASKISKRVVLQGGISYLTQNSTYTSNTASGSGAYINDYASTASRENADKNQITVTRPYQVNNNLQYMSIPLQAGYIIIDRDFGLQLNAGIATDVFFQNTLTPEGSDLNEVKQGPGADSPYRTLNFSGLLGTELSYKLSDHYRIALNPGFRYALNSIYKSEVVAEVSPMTFDVALRFRYMF